MPFLAYFCKSLQMLSNTVWKESVYWLSHQYSSWSQLSLLKISLILILSVMLRCNILKVSRTAHEISYEFSSRFLKDIMLANFVESGFSAE